LAWPEGGQADTPFRRRVAGPPSSLFYRWFALGRGPVPRGMEPLGGPTGYPARRKRGVGPRRRAGKGANSGPGPACYVTPAKGNVETTAPRSSPVTPAPCTNQGDGTGLRPGRVPEREVVGAGFEDAVRLRFSKQGPERISFPCDRIVVSAPSVERGTSHARAPRTRVLRGPKPGRVNPEGPGRAGRISRRWPNNQGPENPKLADQTWGQDPGAGDDLTPRGRSGTGRPTD